MAKQRKKKSASRQEREPDVNGWLSAKEAAALLGVQPLTIYRWVAAGSIKSQHFGRTVRVQLEGRAS